jgi:hypothetical protein
MRGLEEIKQINANPQGYHASRYQADTLHPRGPVGRPPKEVQREHGKRVEARQRQNGRGA